MLKGQVGLHDIENSACGQEKERTMCNMQERENQALHLFPDCCLSDRRFPEFRPYPTIA